MNIHFMNMCTRSKVDEHFVNLHFMNSPKFIRIHNFELELKYALNVIENSYTLSLREFIL